MPLEMKFNNFHWRCIDFENKTFVINNVLLKTAERKPEMLRIARLGDLMEDMIKVNLSFIGIVKPYFYVRADKKDEIEHPDLFWFFAGNDVHVKIYAPKEIHIF